MVKTAIFVEGHTELIFVREMLLKIFQHENIDVGCYNLFTDDNLNETEYAHCSPEAEYQFQIINVGNDARVKAAMNKRKNSMFRAGFTRLIGLRDMYSKEYRDLAKEPKVDQQIIARFENGYREGFESEEVKFCFAIMEIEAWLLGMDGLFERIDNTLTVEYIKEKMGYDLAATDPEQHFFRPAECLSDILAFAGMENTKRQKNVNAMMSRINKEDFYSLLSSNKCQSFKDFYSYLGIAS